ncbi:MAG: helix-turn-helix transcriptional regulator [Chitinophagales bacterium]|nr:helix-turn-helix transcriptional regulator [Hyphomicrobiales bacterium]
MTAKETDLALPEGCPLDKLLKFFATEWTAHIIWTLGRTDELRFGMLRRSLPGDVSARVLSARLKQLVAKGLINRNDFGTTPLHVSYSLTAEGKLLDALLVKIAKLSEEMPLSLS